MWYNMSMDKKTIILAALAVVVIMNIAAFALMGHDKRCARQGKWRVPEKTLFLVTACSITEPGRLRCSTKVSASIMMICFTSPP